MFISYLLRSHAEHLLILCLVFNVSVYTLNSKLLELIFTPIQDYAKHMVDV